MMSLFCNLPTKKEEYAIVSRRLTLRELDQVVKEVYDESLIWHDDPRSWFCYSAFLGFQINKAMFTYQIGENHANRDAANQERNDFIAACLNYAMEQGESL